MTGEPRGEAEVTVEELAGRLGLPVSMLIRRIDEGVLPGRRVEGAGGVEYVVRADSLDPGEPGDTSAGSAPEPAYPWRQPHAVEGAPWPLTGRPAPAGPPEAEPDAGIQDAAAADPDPGLRLSTRDEEPPTRLDDERSAPAELAALGLDARELVAALLERWERTLEQRVHAEYRLRYETALSARQAEMKQLSHELDGVRAQLAVAAAERDAYAAERDRLAATHSGVVAQLREQLESGSGALAERDRLVADRERAIAARDRVLAEQRREAAERDRSIAELGERLSQREVEIEALQLLARRRRGFFRR